MIQQTAPTTPPFRVTAVPGTRDMYRVECCSGRPKLVSNAIPSRGYTAYCRKCTMPHLIQWSDFSSDVLRVMVEAMSEVLSEREVNG